MKLLLIILIILLILFAPIPLKLNIYVSKKDYYVKLYKFTLISKQKVILKKEKEKNLKKTKLNNKKISKLFKQNNFKIENFKSLILKLNKSNFKPFLKIKFTLDYSLNDAARTAIFYGIIYQLSDIFRLILNVPFKTKKYVFDVKPIFRDEMLLKFEISSIIFLSLVHIIYILILIFRSITNVREVNP